MYCSHCKKDLDILKDGGSAFAKRGNSTYYHCRPCNTARCKKYREQSKKNRETVYGAVYASMRKHPQKQAARQRVFKAIKSGIIDKPTLCSCGGQNPEAHHPDYSKPLEVMWMCRGCHASFHRKERTKEVITV